MNTRLDQQGATQASSQNMKATPLYRRIFSHVATPWVILGSGLFVSTLIAIVAKQVVNDKAEVRFQYQSNEVRNTLLQRLEKYELALHSGAALFNASYSVERLEWYRFVQSLNIATTLPGVQGIGFSQVILPTALSKHTRTIQAEGFPHYQIRPAGERPLYTSIIYLEPFDWRNQRAFGYDMWSEPVRRQAMEQARDSGLTAISSTVKLVQETEQDVQPGFLMYVPVYYQGMPLSNIGERRAALQGFVYSPFRVHDLMESIFKGRFEGIAIELYDGKEVIPKHRFYAAQFSKRGENDVPLPEGGPEQRLTLTIAGHDWTLRTRPLPDRKRTLETNLPIFLGLGGALSTLLLFLYLRTLARTQQAAETLARAMTLELSESEEENRTLVEFAPDAVIVINHRGIIVRSNPASEHFFGYQASELLGQNVSMLMPDVHRRHHDRYISHYLETGETHVIGTGRDVEAQRKDGSRVPIHLRVGEQHMRDGSVRFIGFVRDLTERVHIQKALEERESLLRNVIETSKDGFWVADISGAFIEVNDTYCRLSGYGRDELLRMHVQDVEATESHDEITEHINKVVRSGSDIFESWHRHRDGQIWPVEISVTYVPEQGGRFIAFCRDIRERKAAELELTHNQEHLELRVKERTAELRHQELRTRLILESAADGIYGTDAQGLFTFVNPAACRMLGYPAEALIGQPAHATIHHSHPDGTPYPKEECKLHNAIDTQMAVRFDHEVFWRANGEALHVSVAGQSIRQDGVSIGSVLSFTDIHQRLETEQKLQEQFASLEKFNRIMVGRELDMIRLKREVNELAERLGQKPRYDLNFVQTSLRRQQP